MAMFSYLNIYTLFRFLLIHLYYSIINRKCILYTCVPWCQTDSNTQVLSYYSESIRLARAVRHTLKSLFCEKDNDILTYSPLYVDYDTPLGFCEKYTVYEM